MSGSLSVIIPTWSGTEKLARMALELAQRVKPMCDELIITEDGNYYEELEAIADKYLTHSRVGHAPNLAIGLKAATSEFVAMIDSDMTIVEGTLRDLCIPGHVVCPETVQGRTTEVAGWFFCCPREWLDAFPPHDQPSQGLAEGIDVWTSLFNGMYRDRLISTNKIICSHSRGSSYGVLLEWARMEYNIEADKRKEVDRSRHKARMLEDPDYAERERRRSPREVMAERHLARLNEDEDYALLWSDA